MSGRSLRLRLGLAAAATLVSALLAAWFGLTLLFERHVERRFAEQLGIHVQSLAARLVVEPDGRLGLSRPLSEPRFEQPLSGLYWAITDARGRQITSRSLWDQALPPARASSAPSSPRRTSELLILERTVRPLQGGQAEPAVIQVAMTRQEIEAARREFSYELAASLALLGLVLALAAWIQIEVGLRPLSRLRLATAALANDPGARLDGRFPSETGPLVTAINRLLDLRAATIRAAKDRAADLAHGLKTPLSVLGNQADRLERAGHLQEASILRSTAAAMSRQVDRELSQTRAAVTAESGPTRCEVRPLAAQLIGVVGRTAEGERLEWINDLPAGWRAPLAADDLAEALGPILENAAAHALRRVRISADGAVIFVDDDGSGMPEAARTAAPARGVRLDERGGQGLGLAIASQILGAYSWGLSLEASPLGGLRVAIGARRA